MELDSVALVREAWYRLCGTDADDDYLTAQGEGANEVAYLYLTRGCRNAQRWMLDMGSKAWRKRSDALTWSGTDATTGGRYSALPTDFLRAFGDGERSALRQANGDEWGTEQLDGEFYKGNYYYFRDEAIWLARNANPPTTLYLEYHYQHPEWTASTTIDFPLDSRWLIIAEAANAAKEEDWLPGGPEMEVKIDRALTRAREEVRKNVRYSKRPRQIQKRTRYGNHW